MDNLCDSVCQCSNTMDYVECVEVRMCSDVPPVVRQSITSGNCVLGVIGVATTEPGVLYRGDSQQEATSWLAPVIATATVISLILMAMVILLLVRRFGCVCRSRLNAPWTRGRRGQRQTVVVDGEVEFSLTPAQRQAIADSVGFEIGSESDEEESHFDASTL
ncbi:unnamed protein product [Owenia fusiformis]|uniref:Uncharacterized protein n=1 Tax=Owenia fusiformis TaxID=6347 RepID=A0A8J1UW24_OWEFU|nr:unnamed protein product [Owenia fusiformis]